MKILHVITDLYTGGAEQALYNLLKGGLSGRFENYVVSLRAEGPVSDKIRALGIPLTHLGMRLHLFSVLSLKKFYDVVEKTSPDILQGWMYHGNLVAAYGWKRMHKTPALIWNIRHSLDGFAGMGLKTRGVVRLGRFFSRHPREIIYNSRISRVRHEAYGFAGRRGVVIPNGIDVRRFSPDLKKRREMRSRLEVPQDVLVVGHVARFHPMKDHITFLRAAVLLLEAGEDVFFLMAGKKITSENKKITQFIPNKWKERFRFLGERSDIPALMEVMDVFCLSSWTEAFPNVLGEAMACEVPCVTTDVGDAAEIVGDTGTVVPPKDPMALARGIEKLLLMSSEERYVLGQKARERIVRFYSLPKMVERYQEVYGAVENR